MAEYKENKMGTTPIFKLLITMALPLVISMLIQSLYNIVDSVYVGKFSKDALTAVGLAFPMQNLMIAMSTGIGVGINANLSKSLGERNNKKASLTAFNGLFIMLIIFIIFLVIGFTLIPTYMKALSTNQAVINYGVDYLRIVVIGCFGMLFAITFERLLQSTGKTGLVMFSQGSGAIINIILDPLLINGFWFIPAMEIKGAAFATIIGQFSSMIISLILNVKFNKDIKLNNETARIDLRLIKSILVVGIPSAIMAAIGSVLTFLMNTVLLRFEHITIPGTNQQYGDLPQTVYGLYFKLNSLFFMPIFGINNAVVPIVAYNYGARNKKKMLTAMKYSMILVSSLMLIGTSLFLAIPSQLLSIFADNKETASLLALVGKPCLRIISSSFMLAAFCIVLMSMFQALGNGIASMCVSCVRQLVILLPVAYLLSLTNNLNLVWLAFLVAEIVALALSILLFIKMYRAKIKTLGAN